MRPPRGACGKRPGKAVLMRVRDCPECGVVFSTQSRLRRHLNNFHAAAWPETRCLVCKSNYASVGQRMRHEVWCQVPMKCTNCDIGLTFKSKTAFEKHVQQCGKKMVRVCKFAPECSWSSKCTGYNASLKQKKSHETYCLKSNEGNILRKQRRNARQNQRKKELRAQKRSGENPPGFERLHNGIWSCINSPACSFTAKTMSAWLLHEKSCSGSDSGNKEKRRVVRRRCDFARRVQRKAEGL